MTKIKTKTVTGFNDKTLANLAETGKIEGLADKLIKMREDLNSGFSQEMVDESIQKKIADGSLANMTIIDNSITNAKYKNGSITPQKTTFFQVDKSTNLFDGNYINAKLTGSEKLTYQVGDINCKTAIIEIKPNTTYSIIKDKVSRFNLGTSTKLLKNGEILDSFHINLSTQSSPLHYTFTTGVNDKYLYVNVTINNDDVFLQIVEGTQNTLTVDKYTINPVGLNIYNKDETNILINEIKNKKIDYSNTDFFKKNIENLFSEDKILQDVKIGNEDGSMNLQKKSGSRTLEIEVQPNTIYSVTIGATNLIYNSKNYFKILTSSNKYNPNVDYWSTGRNINTKIEKRNYTFTTGANDKYLYIYYTDKNETPKIQIVEGEYSNFVDVRINPVGLNIYNKDEINELISSKKIIVNKVGVNLNIYVPSKKSNNYIHYFYKKIDDDTVNMHQWRVLKTYLVDKDFNDIFDFDGQTEWEGAIKEKGAADFVSGFHGDETNEFISVMIDGNEIDLHGDDFTKSCGEIRIVNKSIINRCDTPGDNIFTRYKVNTWNLENYIVENKYIALQDFHIISSKLCLMSCRYTNSSTQGQGERIIDTARNNHDYVKYDISSAFGTSGIGAKQKDVTEMEMWSNVSGMHFRLQCDYEASKYPNRNQYIEDFRSQNRAKVYFDLTGDYIMSSGEELKCKSIFTIYG